MDRGRVELAEVGVGPAVVHQLVPTAEFLADQVALLYDPGPNDAERCSDLRPVQDFQQRPGEAFHRTVIEAQRKDLVGRGRPPEHPRGVWQQSARRGLHRPECTYVSLVFVLSRTGRPRADKDAGRAKPHRSTEQTPP